MKKQAFFEPNVRLVRQNKWFCVLGRGVFSVHGGCFLDARPGAQSPQTRHLGHPRIREIREIGVENRPKSVLREASKCFVLPHQARPRVRNVAQKRFAKKWCSERQHFKINDFGASATLKLDSITPRGRHICKRGEGERSFVFHIFGASPALLCEVSKSCGWASKTCLSAAPLGGWRR